ncbi:MAG: glycosyltransferase family 4 protein [Planctomycetes bacterium]|nr:glycosyltransferase family 4 protein [Planctomycetota bacterium]
MGREPNKTLAFCLFKYFPYGGQQRDMLRIALACQARGYEIDVYTTAWKGERPPGLRVHLHRPGALTNHGCLRKYHAWLTQQLAAHPPACVVGFQKMPGLDVYYAADVCYQATARAEHGRLYQLLPRYRLYRRFEEAVFGPDSRTQILMISQNQEQSYVQHYGTAAARIHRMPPNLPPDRLAGPQALPSRRALRRTLGFGENDRILLQLGSDFRRKGLDRSILALASLPKDLLSKTWLYVIGSGCSGPFARLARRLGVLNRIVFIGPRDDVPQLLVAADLLVHPAYQEAAGIVLLEALACGLPVVVSGICGYAPYIAQAQAGWVLAEPFDQALFNRTVRAALERGDLAEIGRRGIEFARRENLCGMVDAALAVVEAVARNAAT